MCVLFFVDTQAFKLLQKKEVPPIKKDYCHNQKQNHSIPEAQW